MKQRLLKKKHIKFIEENKKEIELVAKYGSNKEVRAMAEALLVAYKREKIRRYT